ncbi:hypothetical protein Tco_1163934 [Tanacetum coccineum]
MYRPPSELSRQEEFEHIVMNFILDQEERIKQLEEYMKVIVGNSKGKGAQKGNPPHLKRFLLKKRSEGLGYNPNHLGVRFRLGGEQKEISLLELGWRIGLYFEGKSRENATLSRLRDYNTVKESRLLLEFWPTIRDGGFNVGNTKVASIRDLRVKLAHRCIPTTIAGRKETTHRVTEIDLNYLYCIYIPEVACNIPMCAWLAIRAMEEEEDEDDDEGDEAARGGAGHEEAGGSTAMYRNTSQDERANWMYDHIVLQFQYMSTHDNLDLHLQIDPFPRREADYPPYGYTIHMPPGYEYRFGPAPGGSEKFLIKNEEEIFTDVGDGVRIYPDNVIFDEKKLESS